MIQPLDQVAQQISRTDQQLQYYLILEQQETNRLLRQMLDMKPDNQPNEIDELKRPDLMKRMAKLENKPQGWNTWGTERIRTHLKEVV